MGCFAYITHPRQMADIKRLYPVARYLPAVLVDAAAPRLLPGRASPITGIRSGHAAADGWLVTCPVTSRQIATLPLPFITGRIAMSARMAAGLGARVIGIGTLAFAGDIALRISAGLGLEVTSGGNYTLAATLDAARMAAGLMARTMSLSDVALLGGETRTGSVAARILAREAGSLTLIAGTDGSLAGLAEMIAAETGLVARITRDAARAIRQCDILVSAGGGIGIAIGGAEFKRGAVLCDLRGGEQGWGLAGASRADVLVVDGGLVDLPGEVQFAGEQTLRPRACDPRIAEAAMLAMEASRRPVSRIDITVEGVDEVETLARKHGFVTACIAAHGRPLARHDIDRARQAAGVA